MALSAFAEALAQTGVSWMQSNPTFCLTAGKSLLANLSSGLIRWWYTALRLRHQKAQVAELSKIVACQVGCSQSTIGLAIGELVEASGHLERAAPVLPIVSAVYPTPVQRSAYSLLDYTRSRELLDLRSKHWRHDLREVIADVGS